MKEETRQAPHDSNTQLTHEQLAEWRADLAKLRARGTQRFAQMFIEDFERLITAAESWAKFSQYEHTLAVGKTYNVGALVAENQRLRQQIADSSKPKE